MAEVDLPGTPKEPEGGDLLRQMRGSRVSFKPLALPSLPPTLSTIENESLRQHVRDAWMAASRLIAVIEMWERFLIVYQLHLSISDDNQRAITAIFPALAQMQTILDHLARLPHGGEPALAVSDETAFPAQAFSDFLGNVERLIRELARVLATIGVSSPSFCPGASPGLPRLEPLDGIVDFTQNPPRISLRKQVQPELLKLKREVRHLLELLEQAPATALLLPKHQLPPPPRGIDRLSVTLLNNQSTIKLDETIYEVTPAAAAFVRAIVAAQGLWRSSKNLKQDEAELEGARLDRIRSKLPDPIKDLIESKAGAGFRLKIELLE